MKNICWSPSCSFFDMLRAAVATQRSWLNCTQTRLWFKQRFHNANVPPFLAFLANQQSINSQSGAIFRHSAVSTVNQRSFGHKGTTPLIPTACHDTLWITCVAACLASLKWATSQVEIKQLFVSICSYRGLLHPCFEHLVHNVMSASDCPGCEAFAVNVKADAMHFSNPPC